MAEIIETTVGARRFVAGWLLWHIRDICGNLLFHHRLEGVGDWGGEVHQLLRDGMDKPQSHGVERKSVDRGGFRPVFAVAGDGMADFLHMDTNLVLPARLQLHGEQRVAVGGLQGLITGEGRLADFRVVGDIDHMLGVLGEQPPDLPCRRHHLPFDDRSEERRVGKECRL